MHALKLAIRTLLRTPFVTGVAIGSLALGIGANAAIYSLFDQMLLRSLPVQEPDRLVNLAAPGPKPGSTSCNSAGGCDIIFSYPMFKDLEAAETGLDGIAAHRVFGANLAHTGSTSSGTGVLVSGSYFTVLGVQPALGRLLTPEDDARVGEHFVTVLSHRYWERELGADPAVLNTTLTINGQPMTVVGVAARGFSGTTLGIIPDVFVPITMRPLMTPGWEGFENRRSYWVYLFGRMGAGKTVEQTDQEINRIYSGIINDVEVPLQNGLTEQSMQEFTTKRIRVGEGSQGQSSLNDEAETPLYLLMSITALVLIIACANIANLLLARGTGRAQEMAVRGSLGASRGQLLRQLLTESVVLGLLGGAASLVVARLTLVGIGYALPPQESEALALTLSPTIVGFSALLALVTGLLFGLYPALHATRQDLVSMLKAGGGQPAAARSAARFRSALVTAQIALSMGLLVSAGLFIKSLMNVSNVDLGLQTENLVTFGVSPQLNGYEPERSHETYLRLTEELEAIPGVSAVTIALVGVLGGNSWGTDVSVEGFESGPGIDSNSRLNRVGPGYFSTLGMPLLAGREFTDSDVMGAPEVAIVNEAFTRKFNLDGRNAIGKFMATGGSGQDELTVQIVGVVQDASYSDVKEPAPALFFTPYRQQAYVGSQSIYVRGAMEPSQILRAVPDAVRRVDPNLPVEDLKTLDQQLRENVYFDRMIGMLSAAFAGLATLLAAIGLYGVLAYSVAQRTREIGVRMALGAKTSNVRSLVLKQVTQMTVVGGVIGIVAAYYLGRLAQSLLFGLEGNDPIVMISVAVLLGAVALMAGYLPARRATKIDPVHALKYD